MSTSGSAHASSAMNLNEGVNSPMPFLDHEFSNSPSGSSHFSPAYPTQSYLSPSTTQVGFSYCSPALQRQSYSRVSLITGMEYGLECGMEWWNGMTLLLFV